VCYNVLAVTGVVPTAAQQLLPLLLQQQQLRAAHAKRKCWEQ
jgi:hypothetical protein